MWYRSKKKREPCKSKVATVSLRRWRWWASVSKFARVVDRRQQVCAGGGRWTGGSKLAQVVGGGWWASGSKFAQVVGGGGGGKAAVSLQRL